MTPGQSARHMDDAEKAPKPLSAEEFEVLNVDVEC